LRSKSRCLRLSDTDSNTAATATNPGEQLLHQWPCGVAFQSTQGMPLPSTGSPCGLGVGVAVVVVVVGTAGVLSAAAR